MAKTPPSASAADDVVGDNSVPPVRPPQPLLPVPASRLPMRAQGIALVPGLAAPSPVARAARQAATQARTSIERTITQARAVSAELKNALATAQTADGAAEWNREGVDAAVVAVFNDQLEALLKQFTAPAA